MQCASMSMQKGVQQAFFGYECTRGKQAALIASLQVC